jgi:hypothetical protein
MSLVVFLVRTAPRERDLVVFAVPEKVTVQESAVVI